MTALDGETEAPSEPSEAAALPPPERLDRLTALRAVAATAVVLFHFGDGPFDSLDLPRYIPFVDHYYLGVDLFFILSGFILAHVHGREFDRLCAPVMARFYILRLARIYPVHCAMLGTYFALFLVLRLSGARLGITLSGPSEHYAASAFIAHLLLMSPGALSWNFPAWSVSAEWFAYVWFPLLAVPLQRLSPRRSFLLLAALTAAFALFYGLRFAPSMDRLGLARVSFEFAGGMLLYRASFGVPRARMVSALGAVAVPAVMTLRGGFADFGCVMLLGCAIAWLGQPGRGAPSTAPRPLLWLGEISYSLYMVQALVMATAGRVATRLMPHLAPVQRLALVPLLLGLTILAAALVHHAVERPARAWMRAHLPNFARSTRARLRAARA